MRTNNVVAIIAWIIAALGVALIWWYTSTDDPIQRTDPTYKYNVNMHQGGKSWQVQTQ